MNVIGENSISVIKKGPGLNYMPDGSIRFKELNNMTMKAEFKVNDCRDLDYHRINGISKNRERRIITSG